VRKLAEAETLYDFLLTMPGASERLELVAAELMTDRSFDDAVVGCDYVIHTASPYTLDVKDAKRDLVDPAVMGTRTVLESCRRAAGIKRVVLTSSIAAVTEEGHGQVCTEADWNETSTLTRNPYFYSKTCAERAAWAFMEEERPGFDLVVINPCWVIGPSFTKHVNQSPQLIKSMLDGEFPMLLDLGEVHVDVRDVAKAHILAMDSTVASGRYLCGEEAVKMRTIAEVLESSGYSKRWPWSSKAGVPRVDMSCRVGTFAARCASWTKPSGQGDWLRGRVGKPFTIDNSKIKRDLQMEFMSTKQSILDTVTDLAKWGHVPALACESDARPSIVGA